VTDCLEILGFKGTRTWTDFAAGDESREDFLFSIFDLTRVFVFLGLSDTLSGLSDTLSGFSGIESVTDVDFLIGLRSFFFLTRVFTEEADASGEVFLEALRR
jgi:hypothetical protein